MKSKVLRAAVAALALCHSAYAGATVDPAKSAAVAQADENKRLGSHYLRCDGQPNNVTGAETFARFLGAVTLLGLFAPTPESPDPTKRLFGKQGVEACDWLIDRPDGEGNSLRRIPLILGRALHQIEAKNYPAALSDVAKARSEAQALGLVGNPYFERSVGLSFGLIEAEAKMRQSDADGARSAGLQSTAAIPYSYYAALTARPFGGENHTLSEGELAHYRAASRILPLASVQFAARLEEVGRFAEAAQVRDGLIGLFERLDTSRSPSRIYANAAVDYALAGNWERAGERLKQARDNIAELDAAGKEENDRTATIEVLDLYEVLRLAHEGKIDDARRNFASRSLWSAPATGTTMAATTQLRQGARPEQLFGSLGTTADALWTERNRLAAARRLENDSNNKTLFSYILPYSKIGSFESLSGTVWKTDKSRLIGKEKIKDSKFDSVFVYGDPLTQPDALLLHSALVAKARGHKGFIFLILPSAPDRAMVEFVDPADATVPAQYVLAPDAVIAELRQIIPSPDELSARRNAAKKKPTG